MTNEGPPHKNVAIHVNVIQRPDSTYPLIVKPYKLDISQFSEKIRDRVKFTLTNVSDQDVEIELIAGMPDRAEIELPSRIEAGKSAAGELRLLEEVLDQEFEKSFTFQVNDEQSSRFTIPVKRTIKHVSLHTALPTATAGDTSTPRILLDTVIQVDGRQIGLSIHDTALTVPGRRHASVGGVFTEITPERFVDLVVMWIPKDTGGSAVTRPSLVFLDEEHKRIEDLPFTMNEERHSQIVYTVPRTYERKQLYLEIAFGGQTPMVLPFSIK